MISSAPAATNPPPDIIVVAERRESSVHDVAGSVQVIDGDSIHLVTASTVADALSTAIGVDVQAGTFPAAASRVNMRGLTDGWGTKRILVMVDGRSVHDAVQGLAEVGLMPVSGIERIEIIRGPASTLYGSQAEAGVINIVTRRSRGGNLREVDVAGGSFGTLKATAAQEGTVAGADYRVQTGYETTDGHEPNSDGTDRDWSTLHAGASVDFELGARSRGWVTAGAAEAEGTEENSDHERDSQHVMLEAVSRPGDPWRSDIKSSVYAASTDDRYAWKYGGEGAYRQEALGGSLQDSLWVHDRCQILAALDARRDQVDVQDNLTSFDETDELAAALLNADVLLSERATLGMGVRLDEHDDFGSEWSPRLSLLHRLGELGEVFTAFSKAYRTPSLADRFIQVEYNGAVFEGNEDLDPETVVAYEVGTRMRAKELWSVEGALFWNEMKDSFDFVLESDGVFRPQNVTASESYGLEVAARRQLSGACEVFTEYGFTGGEYTDHPDAAVEGNTLLYLVERRAEVGVELDFLSAVAAVLSVEYVGDREGDIYNSREGRLSDYWLVNASLRWQWRESVLFRLAVDNILDESYSTFPGVPEPGTAFMAGVSARF